MLSGKPVFERRTGCWPSGVPAFNLYVVLPTYFIQTPTKIVMISQQDNQVRHIYLNVPHSANPTPSWNGESVGHYEGDTLVVDTIGMNERTFVDNFRTPHTTQLHVVERFRMIDDGKRMEVHITVDDPGAYTTTWTAIQRFRRSIQQVDCRRAADRISLRGEQRGSFQFRYRADPHSEHAGFLNKRLTRRSLT